MKRLLSVIAMVMLAVPAFAQDDFVLSGADIDALLGGGNRGNRGNNNNRVQQLIPDPEYMLLDIKDLLKSKKVPLEKDQEKSLKAMLTTESAAIRSYIEGQFANRGNTNTNNRGNNNTNNTQTMLTDLDKTVVKHNTEMLTEMKTSMTPDQVNLMTKAEKDKKVCTVLLDLVNFQQLREREANNFNNRGGRGGGGFDGGFGGGFDIGGFDFPGGFGGGGGNTNNRGNNNNFLQSLSTRPSCTARESTTAQRLEPLAQILTKGKKPLTAEQQTKFAALIEARVPVIEEELKEAHPQMQQLLNSIGNQNRNNNNNNNNANNNNSAVNPQTLRNNIVNTIMTQLGVPNNNNNNNNNNNRGNRGGNANAGNNTNAGNANAASANTANANAGNNTANANAANNTANANAGNNNFFFEGRGRGNNNNNNNNNFNPEAELRKKNEELLDKVAASLKPDQKPVILKLKYDQIKARGGVDRYRAILEQEGTPLTPEQATQIQQLINTQNQAIRRYAEELVTKEVDSLPPAALQPAPQPQNQQNQNPQNRNNQNQNSVNVNPVAQQIVAKVLPEVSKRKALLERATLDSVFKVLTPAQEASYKINSL